MCQIAIIGANTCLEDHRRRGIKSTLIGRHNFCLTQLLCKHLTFLDYPSFTPNISATSPNQNPKDLFRDP